MLLCASLAEAGAFHRLAKVFASHLNTHTHFSQTGAHAIADAVAEGRLARGAFGIGEASAPRLQIGVVGRNDGGELVVIAGVEDKGDRIPDPLVGLLRTQVVEHQHLGRKDRLQQLQFGGLNLRIVTVLDTLEQLTIVAEQAA